MTAVCPTGILSIKTLEQTKRKPLFQELSEFFIWCNRCVTELNYKRDKKPDVYAYDYFKVKFGIEDGGKVTYYSGILNIEVYDDGNPVFYDINEIKEKSQDIGVTELTGSKSSLPNSSAKSSDGIQYSIGGNSGYVGYSMSVRARKEGMRMQGHIEEMKMQ